MIVAAVGARTFAEGVPEIAPSAAEINKPDGKPTAVKVRGKSTLFEPTIEAGAEL